MGGARNPDSDLGSNYHRLYHNVPNAVRPTSQTRTRVLLRCFASLSQDYTLQGSCQNLTESSLP